MSNKEEIIKLAIEIDDVAFQLIKASFQKEINIWETFIEKGWLEDIEESEGKQKNLSDLIKELPFTNHKIANKFLELVTVKISANKISEILTIKGEERSAGLQMAYSYLGGSEKLKLSISKIINTFADLGVDLDREHPQFELNGNVVLSTTMLGKCVQLSQSENYPIGHHLDLADLLVKNGAVINSEVCKEIVYSEKGEKVYAWVNWAINKKLATVEEFKKVTEETYTSSPAASEIVATFERQDKINQIIKSNQKPVL